MIRSDTKNFRESHPVLRRATNDAPLACHAPSFDSNINTRKARLAIVIELPGIRSAERGI
jgi:hypothetical protein